jgi:hypothetical protein
MEELKKKLIAKIKMIHKIPQDDELDLETEIFLDYFSKEMIDFFKENENGDKQD